MWVNPHWEEEKNSHTQEKGQSNQDEVIINGVSFFQFFEKPLWLTNIHEIPKNLENFLNLIQNRNAFHLQSWLYFTNGKYKSDSLVL